MHRIIIRWTLVSGFCACPAFYNNEWNVFWLHCVEKDEQRTNPGSETWLFLSLSHLLTESGENINGVLLYCNVKWSMMKDKTIWCTLTENINMGLQNISYLSFDSNIKLKVDQLTHACDILFIYLCAVTVDCIYSLLGLLNYPCHYMLKKHWSEGYAMISPHIGKWIKYFEGCS